MYVVSCNLLCTISLVKCLSNVFVKVAERQGEYLANQLCGKDHEKFTFQSRGMLAYIGRYEGVSDIPKIKMQGMGYQCLYSI